MSGGWGRGALQVAPREGDHSPSTMLGTGWSPEMSRIAKDSRLSQHGGQE